MYIIHHVIDWIYPICTLHSIHYTVCYLVYSIDYCVYIVNYVMCIVGTTYKSEHTVYIALSSVCIFSMYTKLGNTKFMFYA